MATALQYYNVQKETFDLFDENGDSPKPGQVLYHKASHMFWTPENCQANNINFDLFKEGELEARSIEQESMIPELEKVVDEKPVTPKVVKKVK